MQDSRRLRATTCARRDGQEPEPLRGAERLQPERALTLGDRAHRARPDQHHQNVPRLRHRGRVVVPARAPRAAASIECRRERRTVSIALHRERRENVGASEVAALWSLGWETRFQLHARKRGLIEHDQPDNSESLQIGRLLEPAVAAVVTERTGWQLRKVRRYMPHPRITGMGASLDYEIVSHPQGPGVCEIKTCDAASFATWEGLPPIQYELQLQHQLACAQRSWGVIAMLVSNRHLEIFTRQREPDAILRIETEIPIFWGEVERRTPPAPDYHLDSETLVAIFRSTTHDKVIDLSLDEEALALAVSYKQLAAVASEAEEGKQRIKAKLLERMGDAEVALLPWKGKITSRFQGEREMPAYTKKSYRTWSVTVEDVEGDIHAQRDALDPARGVRLHDRLSTG